MSDHNEESLHEREGKEDPEWDEYRVHVDETQERTSLDRKDYIALFIAALQTIFLPLVIMMAVFVAIALLFSLIW